MTYLTVVVPTRNEADNVEFLVSRVASALQPLDLPWEMLFVDDSDDLTPDRVLEAERAGHPVRLLHRPSPNRVGGLSGAVVLGFEQAAESSIVAVMDGDLQHPPEVLVDLVIAVSSGDADLAIATRPSQLGNGRKGLNRWWRASVSQGARSLVHVAFPRLRVVSDPLAGFFAVHQRVLTDAHLHPEGFKSCSSSWSPVRGTESQRSPARWTLDCTDSPRPVSTRVRRLPATWSGLLRARLLDDLSHYVEANLSMIRTIAHRRHPGNWLADVTGRV